MRLWIDDDAFAVGGFFQDVIQWRLIENELKRERNIFIGGPMMSVSPNVEQFGFRPEYFTSGGLILADLILEEDIAEVERRIADLVEGDADSVEITCRICLSDDRVVWISDHKVPSATTAASWSISSPVLGNVTERKRAEEAGKRLRNVAVKVQWTSKRGDVHQIDALRDAAASAAASRWNRAIKPQRETSDSEDCV